jgi:hypothetical protein
MKLTTASALATLLFLSVSAAQAATVSVSQLGPPNGRSPSAAEMLGGVPPDARIMEFVTTTSADILQIDQVKVTGGVYNTPSGTGGSDSAPPSPLFVTLIPQLGADSWIDTPGATSIAGDSSNPFGTENNSWFDTTNDGAQSNFMFARLTVLSPNWSFTGRVQVAGAAGPESFGFGFPVPEPGSFALAAVGLVGAVAARRRKNG